MVKQRVKWGVAVVKIGFVVEGDTEKLLIESTNFRNWATQHNIEIGIPVINAGGGGNLCPRRIEKHINSCLTQVKPDKLVILTDLECEPCITQVKQRIGNEQVTKIFVARKAIEAWFLADTQAMQKWLEHAEFFEELPEQTIEKPWERLKEVSKRGRGPGTSKIVFAKKFIHKFNFSLEQAAAHPNCQSATYFLEKLKEIAQLAHKSI
jgi:hypothetical protein